MSVATQPHPPKAVLTAFSTGSLQEPVASEVADHLLECDACTQKLLQLQSEDTLLDLLKQQEIVDDSATPTSQPASASNRETDAFELLSDHPRYELLDLIGRGGMGDVFRARHRLMDREVAIKFLNAPRWRKRLQQREAVLRFQREVKAAARLSHPNIVIAFDAEECNGVHFFVMEYIEGENLASYVKQRGPLSIADAVDCLRQVCLGLEVAHRDGMVHRDIKPHNLMVSRGDQHQLRVTVLDFGIASLGQEQSSKAESLPNSELTHSGRIVGTPEYISPEQAIGTSSVDCRADIYSLGATLYFLLMGRPPFSGTSKELLEQHKHASAPECTALSKDTELSSVLKKMLAKSPEDRFQSITELRDSLDFIQDTPTVPVRSQTSRPFNKASIMTAILAIASCLLATIAMWPDDEGSPQTAKSNSNVSATEPSVSAEPSAEAPIGQNTATVLANAKPILVNANQPKKAGLEITPSMLPPSE
ncbi:MAG: serine/threonine-protein kinase, partial [Planctomycetota bacterium]